MLMRFKESPDPGMVAPGTGDKVMHASVRIGETTVLATTANAEAGRAFRALPCR